MTTEAEDTSVPGWTTLVRAKAAPSFGESAVRQDAAAGRIGHVMCNGSPSVRSTKSKNRESV